MEKMYFTIAGMKHHYGEEYRNSCKDEAFDMLKQYFFGLWD